MLCLALHSNWLHSCCDIFFFFFLIVRSFFLSEFFDITIKCAFMLSFNYRLTFILDFRGAHFALGCCHKELRLSLASDSALVQALCSWLITFNITKSYVLPTHNASSKAFWLLLFNVFNRSASLPGLVLFTFFFFFCLWERCIWMKMYCRRRDVLVVTTLSGH